MLCTYYFNHSSDSDDDDDVETIDLLVKEKEKHHVCPLTSTLRLAIMFLPIRNTSIFVHSVSILCTHFYPTHNNKYTHRT